jgi:hypothetical protein
MPARSSGLLATMLRGVPIRYDVPSAGFLIEKPVELLVHVVEWIWHIRMRLLMAIKELDTAIAVSNVIGAKESGRVANKRSDRGHANGIEGAGRLRRENTSVVPEKLIESSIAYLSLTPVRCQKIA